MDGCLRGHGLLSVGRDCLVDGKPALTQMAGQAITTTANSKLNGTLSFSSLDISLKGQLVLAKPVIRDTQGRVVIEGDAVRVYVNPGKS